MNELLTGTYPVPLQIKMADEDLSLNEDQLLDSLDDANGDSELMTEVSLPRNLTTDPHNL